MIEDTLLPRGPTIRSAAAPSLDESIGKIRAAVRAVIPISWCSGGQVRHRYRASTMRSFEGIRIHRGRWIDVAGAQDPRRLRPSVVGAAIPLVPRMPESMCDEQYLASRRAGLWSSGHQTFSVAVKALYDAMKLVRRHACVQLAGDGFQGAMNSVTGAATTSHGQNNFSAANKARHRPANRVPFKRRRAGIGQPFPISKQRRRASLFSAKRQSSSQWPRK
jgi:carboxyvinyl-carboxyphosphonate phosphorylmutase